MTNTLKQEPPERITLYCNSRRQQEYIRNQLEILRYEMGVEKNVDVIETLIKNHRVIK